MQIFKYNFDTIIDRAGTKTLKYDARAEIFGDPNVIPMWVADMDFECAPAIGEAIRRRAAHNLYGYDFGGERSAPSLVRWLERRSGWSIDPSWLRFTPGVVAGLGFAVRAFTAPGDSIVIQTPVYPPFRNIPIDNGRNVIDSPLKPVDDSYEMDFDDLDRKLADARAIILCNPHNPVGRVFTEDELRRVGELCVKHNVVIISDEIHGDLVFAPYRQVHIAALNPRFAERTITFVAPSKTFNTAGLATSAGIISSEAMREAWDREYGAAHIIDGTVFGHVALCAAYDRCEDWLEEALLYLKGNVDYVRDFLAAEIPAIKTVRQEGTYLMWLDFRELGMEHGELMEWLVRKAGLGLNSGVDFGREGVGFARINVATNRATVEKALRQLAGAVAEHRK
jgi:cystathionine beta-lyase